MVAKSGEVETVNYHRDEDGWSRREADGTWRPVKSGDIPPEVRWEIAEEIRDFWSVCPSGMRMIRYLAEQRMLTPDARMSIIRPLLSHLNYERRQYWCMRLGTNSFPGIVDEFVLLRGRIDPHKDALLADIVRRVRTNVPGARQLPNDGREERIARHWATYEICARNGLGFNPRRRDAFFPRKK